MKSLHYCFACIVDVEKSKEDKRGKIMCVAFDKLSIYQYLFAPDSRFEQSASCNIQSKHISVFCNMLYEDISEEASKNPCYKYVCFNGFDSIDEIYSDDDMLLFVEMNNLVMCLDCKLLERKPEEIERKYSKAYHGDETVPNALKNAKRRFLEYLRSETVSDKELACA